jgi:TRAP-type C4-dicarboxylate transport system permease small subunit
VNADSPVAPHPWIQRARRGYFLAVATLATALLGAIVLIMGVQVVFRYVLGESLIWAEEICRYLIIWTTFLFAGTAFQRGEMVAVEMLVRAVPGPLRKLLVAIGYGLSLVLLAALVYYGWRFAELNARQTIPAADFIASAIAGPGSPIDMSIFWIYVAVPVGSAILFVHIALALAAELVVGRRPADTAAGPA